MPANAMPTLGIIVFCHNEELYLSRCMTSIFASMSETSFQSKVLVILDRCVDKSAEIAKQFPVDSFAKDETTWKYSISENLDIGFKRFFGLDYISVIDADVVVPSDFFRTMINALEVDPELVSVASDLITEKSTMFNKAYSVYEAIFKHISLGESLRGACRVYRGSRIREFGGKIVDDVIAADSSIDQKLGGKRKLISSVKSLHIRRTNFTKCVQGQKTSGMARKQLNLSFFKTALHGIIRLRPFVIVGYVKYHDDEAKADNHVLNQKREFNKQQIVVWQKEFDVVVF